jgi:hypothetical protein
MCDLPSLACGIRTTLLATEAAHARAASAGGDALIANEASRLYAQHLAERGFITLAVGSIDSGQAAGLDWIPQ